MARSHARWLLFSILTLALALIPVGISEGQKQSSKSAAKNADTQTPGEFAGANQSATKDGNPVCRVYALGEFAADANFGKWIAEVIPQVIEPGSWSQQGVGNRFLTYNPGGKILVVYHTATVQAQVAAFLDNLKTAYQAGKDKSGNTDGKTALAPAAVVPAQWLSPVAKALEPTTIPGAYPVPVQPKQPKHLFHFIIRYEGEGIVDSNVVELMKLQAGQNSDAPATKPVTQMLNAPGLVQPGSIIPTGSFQSASPGALIGGAIGPAQGETTAPGTESPSVSPQASAAPAISTPTPTTPSSDPQPAPTPASGSPQSGKPETNEKY